MVCPDCGHKNVTGFEFCEACLSMLARPSAVAASGLSDDLAPPPAADVSLFPWNPKGHKIDPLIGRLRELETGLYQVRMLVERWSARTVLLLGERGVGTSTFVARLAAEARAVDRDLVVAESLCRDEPARPYGAFARVLRDLFAIPQQVDDWVAGDRFLTEVVDLYDADQREAAVELAQLVSYLVGFRLERSPFGAGADGRGREAAFGGAQAHADEDAATLVPRASQALMRLFARLAKDRPLMVVLDDAHRAGGPLLGLVDLLVTGLAHAPVMFLLVGPPELREAAPGWKNRNEITLGPLSRTDAEALLRVLLTGVRYPPELLTRVVERAGGNGLALRSIVRWLHQNAVITASEDGWIADESAFFDMAIPASLDGVASARLAALEPLERAVLHQAAVVGSTFWLGPLVAAQRQSLDAAPRTAHEVGKDRGLAALRATLHSLVSREVIEVVNDRSVTGEDAWRFRLESDREHLYADSPASLRSRMHRVVAQWLETQAAPFVEANLANIARHYALSGDGHRAAQLYASAGRRARAGSALEQALELYTQALRLQPLEDMTDRLTTLYALGELGLATGRFSEARERLREMLQLTWMLRSRHKGAAALNRLGRCHRALGEYAEANAHFQESLQLYRAVEDDRGVADTLEDLGQLAWLEGKLDAATTVYERSKAIRIQHRDARGLAVTLHYLGCIHLDRFELDAAEKHFSDALALRRKADDRAGVSMTLNNLAVVWWTRGEVARAEEAWRECLAMARDLGSRHVAAMLMTNLAESAIQQERYADAENLLHEAELLAGETGDRRTLGTVFINCAALAMARGTHGVALMAASRAVEEARALENARLEGLALVALGDVRAGIGHHDGDAKAVREGLATLRQGLSILEHGRMELEWALGSEQLAEVLRRTGDPAGAEAAANAAAKLLAARQVRPPRRRAVAWGTAADFGQEMSATPTSDAPPAEPAAASEAAAPEAGMGPASDAEAAPAETEPAPDAAPAVATEGDAAPDAAGPETNAAPPGTDAGLAETTEGDAAPAEPAPAEPEPAPTGLSAAKTAAAGGAASAGRDKQRGKGKKKKGR